MAHERIDKIQTTTNYLNMITAQETVNKSLHHFSSEQQTEMLTHYLSVTTWEVIVAKF